MAEEMIRIIIIPTHIMEEAVVMTMTIDKSRDKFYERFLKNLNKNHKLKLL